jgi:hypothetical protein
VAGFQQYTYLVRESTPRDVAAERLLRAVEAVAPEATLAKVLVICSGLQLLAEKK